MYLIAQFVGDTGRRDLVHLTFVLGVIVEELIMGDHFGNRESHRFVLGLIDAAGHFGTLHERLADDLIALLESPLNSGIDLLHGLDLGASERGTAYVRFDETGQTECCCDLRRVRPFLSGAKNHTVGNVESEIREVMVAGVLIERERSGQYSAAGVRHADHVQIALQYTVLARRAVDRDIREIERVLHALARKRKIILVNRAGFAISEILLNSHPFREGLGVGYPFLAVQDNDSHLVPLFVHERIQSRRRTKRHIVLAAVPSGNNSNLTLHFFTIYFLEDGSDNLIYYFIKIRLAHNTKLTNNIALSINHNN